MNGLRWIRLGWEFGCVLRALPRIELRRLTEGPAPLLRDLRAHARHRRRRSSDERQDLRRVIRWADAQFPGGGNCYRRSLLEIALDPDSASEPLVMGIRSAGGARSAHAWVGSDSDGGAYDAIIAL
jgi:hypothetical protein